MIKDNKMRKIIEEKSKKNYTLIIVCTTLVVLALFLGILILLRVKNSPNKKVESKKPIATSQSQSKKEAKAVLLSTGDIILHTPFLTAGKQSDGTYNFDYCFNNVKSEISNVDYAVCNFETTLGGKEPYQGYPLFNSPDAITDALKNCGFNLLLCSNNHANDTGFQGMQRTTKITREKGFDQTGAFLNPNEKKYLIKEINGIKFGFINYTYETSSPGKDDVALNGMKLSSEAANCINTFDYDHLDEFYSKIAKEIAEMKKDGAEALILYIHWGDEYKLFPNKYQKQIANKVAELGIDLIVGGHPHVIQPGEVINTKDNRKVYCLYSAGNAISNQRFEYMKSVSKTRHTEDGEFLITEFTRKKDGKTTLSKVSYIPTYVNVNRSGGKIYHNIVIAKQNAGAALNDSYNRTKELLQKSIDEFNNK